MTDENPPINVWFSGGVEYIDRRRPDGQIETIAAEPEEEPCG